MSLPSNWTKVTVTGTYLNFDGSPASGFVRFATPQTIISETDIVEKGELVFNLDANGSFTAQIPATNDPSLSGNQWLYTVSENIVGQLTAVYSLAVNYTASSIDLSTVDRSSLVPPSAGIIAYNYVVENIAAIVALSVPTGPSTLYLRGRTSSGDGGEGTFIWSSADHSTDVTNDPQQGVFVAPSADTTGASGAWVRQYSGEVNGEWFGMSVSSSDNGTALAAAIQHIMGTQGSINSYGGTLYLPGPGTYTCTTNIGVLPNDGNTTAPKQASLTIKGSAAGCDYNVEILGGTVLDLAYAIPGTQNAKIDTRGFGVLTLEDLTITDSAGSSDPFLMTTNTILRRKGMVNFQGTKSGTACDQDAIILGGTSTTIGNGQDAPFQAYGTVIDGFQFSGIRRCVYARVYANSIPITNNSVSANCGSPDANGAPFEISGNPINQTTGLVIENNTIELSGYVYGARLEYATGCYLRNGLFDPGAGTLAGYREESNCSGNLIVSSYCPGSISFVDSQVTGLNKSTVIQAINDGVGFVTPQPGIFTSASVVFKNGNNNGPITEDGAGNKVTVAGNGSSTTPGMLFRITPSGGSMETVATLFDAGSGTYLFEVKGTNSQILGNGTLTLKTIGNEIDLNVNGTRIGYLLKTYAAWAVPHHGLASNSGATGNRPSATLTGQQYFDTTLGKPIWWNGSGWVDATGASA